MTDKIGPALETLHEEEDDRLEQIARYVVLSVALEEKYVVVLTGCRLKARSKGAPKKKSGPPGKFHRAL